MTGSNGINCSNICPYPTFGVGCQGSCDCNETMCDVSRGCEPITAGTYFCLPSVSTDEFDFKTNILLYSKISKYILLCCCF